MLRKLYFGIFSLLSVVTALFWGGQEVQAQGNNLFIYAGGGGGGGTSALGGGTSSMGGGGGAGAYVGSNSGPAFEGGNGLGVGGGRGSVAAGSYGTSTFGGLGGKTGTWPAGSDGASVSSSVISGGDGASLQYTLPTGEYGDLHIVAGSGGFSSLDGNPSRGGNGGNVTVAATSLSVAKQLVISSGAKHDNAGHDYGQGGAASFTAETVIVQTVAGGSGTLITFTRQDADLLVQIGTLDASANDVTMNLDGTKGSTRSATDMVYFGNLILGGGKSFTVSSTKSGDFDFGALTVRGQAGSQAAYTGDLDAENKNLDFILPRDIAAGDTLLTVDGVASITGSNVRIGLDNDLSNMQINESIVLLSATALSGEQSNDQYSIMLGLSRYYNFGLNTTDDDELIATLQGITDNPQLKAFLEGNLAGVILLNQAGDLAAGQGLDWLRYAAEANNRAGRGGAFAYAGAGAAKTRNSTGSYIDLLGGNLLAGLGWDFAGGQSGLLAGLFFESGLGKYETLNDFDDFASVAGEGDLRYWGGGLQAMYRAPSGFYADGSLRLGRIYNNFSSEDLVNPLLDAGAEFETASAYYGAHLGLGYFWAISEKTGLDLYAKYLWNHQNGSSVDIAGETYTFEPINSQRLRLGARLAWAVPAGSGLLSPYLGAAYEYEFDGQASGDVNGRPIEAPSFKGGTGIGELGLDFVTGAKGNIHLNLALRGYLGQQRGVSGHFTVGIAF